MKDMKTVLLIYFWYANIYVSVLHKRSRSTRLLKATFKVFFKNYCFKT